jgi:hypothetical protein
LTVIIGETFEKCLFLIEFKEGDPPRRINRRNTFSISRIELKLHFVQNVEPDTEIGQKDHLWMNLPKVLICYGVPMGIPIRGQRK